MKNSRKTDAANRTSDIAAGSLYRKSVLCKRISFGRSVLFSLDIKAWHDSQQLSVSVSEKALCKQAVKDLKRLTVQYVSSRSGIFSQELELVTYRN